MSPRFSETTRGRVIALLQRDARTVDEIATELGLTDNAVRAHIVAMERDGLVVRRGTRPTGTRPAYSYELTDLARRELSNACLPVLTGLMEVLGERLPAAELGRVLTEVGRRLARCRAAGIAGTVRARAVVAAAALRELGGVVDVEECEGRIILHGRYCPLAEVVKANPLTCKAAEAMISDLVQAPVTECCEQGERPRCRFEITLDAGNSSVAVA